MIDDAVQNNHETHSDDHESSSPFRQCKDDDGRDDAGNSTRQVRTR